MLHVFSGTYIKVVLNIRQTIIIILLAFSVGRKPKGLDYIEKIKPRLNIKSS